LKYHTYKLYICQLNIYLMSVNHMVDYNSLRPEGCFNDHRNHTIDLFSRKYHSMFNSVLWIKKFDYESLISALKQSSKFNTSKISKLMKYYHEYWPSHSLYQQLSTEENANFKLWSLQRLKQEKTGQTILLWGKFYNKFTIRILEEESLFARVFAHEQGLPVEWIVLDSSWLRRFYTHETKRNNKWFTRNYFRVYTKITPHENVDDFKSTLISIAKKYFANESWPILGEIDDFIDNQIQSFQEYMHNIWIYHGHLKGANILVEVNAEYLPILKIIDWDISCIH